MGWESTFQNASFSWTGTIDKAEGLFVPGRREEYGWLVARAKSTLWRKAGLNIHQILSFAFLAGMLHCMKVFRFTSLAAWSRARHLTPLVWFLGPLSARLQPGRDSHCWWPCAYLEELREGEPPSCGLARDSSWESLTRDPCYVHHPSANSESGPFEPKAVCWILRHTSLLF